MNTNKKTATIAGALFITATVAGILSVVFTKPILDTPDCLIKISANENQVLLGALFLFIMALASAGIGISLYPILKNIMKVSRLDLLALGLLRGYSILLV